MFFRAGEGGHDLTGLSGRNLTVSPCAIADLWMRRVPGRRCRS